MSNFAVELKYLICSFEYSKKLRDAGVKLSTWFYWSKINSIIKTPIIYYFKDVPKSQRQIAIPAPTSGELDLILHLIGFKVHLTDSELYNPKAIPEDGYWYDLEPLDHEKWDFTVPLIFRNAVDAKADAIIWLIDQKIVDPKTIII